MLLMRIIQFSLAACLLLVSYSGFPPPAQAQNAELLLRVRETHLALLSPEYDPISMRVTGVAGQSLWFYFHSSPGLILSPSVQEAAGTLIPASLSGPAEALVLNFTPPQDAEYRVILTATADSAPGYTRLYYTQSEVPPVATEGGLNFLGSPVVNAFHEPFDNNDRAWWVGATKEAESKIENGVMTMALSTNGQLLGGFTSVEGTQEPYHYLTATVTLENAGLGTNFGLLFRVLDTANYYLFQIWPEQGSWRFLALLEGQWINGFGWHQDERLLNATGQHEVGVVVLNDIYIFMWDGQPLGHLTDPTFSQGGIGLFAEVAPDIASNPTYIWDDVRVGVQDLMQPWGASFLPDAAAMSPSSSLLFQTTITEP
jgi:hypothetical protein